MSLLRRACEKLFRRNRGRAIWRQDIEEFHSISFNREASKEQAIAMFREMFAHAYPDAEKFLSRLQFTDEANGDIFQLRGSFCATGSLGARGLQYNYRKWEEDTVKAIQMKYPDLKVLIFHYPSPEENKNQS